MSQTTAASEIVSEHIEDVHDLFDKAYSDRHIDEQGVARIKARLDWAVHYADSAIIQRAIGVYVIRGDLAVIAICG